MFQQESTRNLVFTPTELETLEVISKGILSRKNLAARRNVTTRAIDSTLAVIRGKLHSKNGLELAFKLCELKILPKLSSTEKKYYDNLQLTSKEWELISLLLTMRANFTYKKASQQVPLTEIGVKKIFNNIRNKLHCHNLAELVIKLHQGGIIQ